jgi:hypothetical protein
MVKKIQLLVKVRQEAPGQEAELLFLWEKEFRIQNSEF